MIICICGVNGSGKTTIGRRLAAKLGFDFADADDYHSEENKSLMRQGIGLNDTLRFTWLCALRRLLCEWHEQQRNGILACSALKQKYRHLLNTGLLYQHDGTDNFGNHDSVKTNLQVLFLMLDVNFEVVRERLYTRHDHPFLEANAGILRSQFATLEKPAVDDPRHLKLFREQDATDSSSFYYIWLVEVGAEASEEQVVDFIVGSLNDVHETTKLG